MGLDMYLKCNDYELTKKLNATGKVGSNECSDLYSKGYKDAGNECFSNGIIIYWRKANCIHQWFVENIQQDNDDCNMHAVTLDELRVLRDVCQEVLNASELVEQGTCTRLVMEEYGLCEQREVPRRVVKDPAQAASLLPTSNGFFFGETSYEEDYLHDVEFTRNRLNDILECFSTEEDCLYPYDPTYKHKDWVVEFTYQASW